MAVSSDSTEYVDLKELSRRSPLSISTLRRYVAEGKIEAFQPGGPGSKLLFRPDALERLAATVRPSQPGIPPPHEKSGHLAGRKPAWMTVQMNTAKEAEKE
jgi:hypothetical protein